MPTLMLATQIYRLLMQGGTVQAFDVCVSCSADAVSALQLMQNELRGCFKAHAHMAAQVPALVINICAAGTGTLG
eukprot:1139838-Pelagomonas_calceolata.AAC.7